MNNDNCIDLHAKHRPSPTPAAQLAEANARFAELAACYEDLREELEETRVNRVRSVRAFMQLAAKLEDLSTEHAKVQAELAAARAVIACIEVECGQASIDGRTTEATLIAVLGRLLGPEAATRLVEVVEVVKVVEVVEMIEAKAVEELELRREPERPHLHLLEQA